MTPVVSDNPGDDQVDVSFTASAGGGGSPYVVAGSGAAVDVTGTTTETDLASIAVPANALTANGFVRLHLIGDLLFNTGAPTLTLRVKADTTTLWGLVTTQGNSANRRAVVLDVVFGNENSATDNAVSVDLELGDTVAADAGTGAIGRVPTGIGGIHRNCGIDTTVAWNLKVTAQWSASSGNSIRKLHYLAETIAI